MLALDKTIYFNKNNKNQCLFNILNSPENQDFIFFGNSLIRKYPITFDKET